MRGNEGRKPAGSSRLETAVGAFAAAAVANLAVVVFLGGYNIDVHGVAIEAHRVGAPLLTVVTLLGLRWLLSLERHGLKTSLRSLFPWGAVGAVSGLALFVLVSLRQQIVAPLEPLVTVGGLATAGYVLAWLSYGPPLPRHARAIVLVLFLVLSAGLADSLLRRELWSPTAWLPRSTGADDAMVPVDRVGLLTGQGSDVSFGKVAAGNDWRNAAVVKPGGFFASKATFAAGSSLAFSVACQASAAGAKALVTVVQGSRHEIAWEEDASSAIPRTWTDVDVTAPFEGKADVVFEVTGSATLPPILFANPRVRMKPSGGAGRPNVILMLVDALRADRLSLYGYARPTSREIDRLASNATVFENCIAQASWTLPSVATIFTSLYPTAHGVVRRVVPGSSGGLSPSVETLAECFQKAGYRTYGITANKIAVPNFGICKGFDEFYAYPPLEVTAANKRLYHNAAEINERALGWLASHREEPFFLYLHYMDVHGPYEPPDEFRTFGTSKSDLYDAQIPYFSREFGLFFEKLEKAGIAQNTILVLISDHGEQLLEHAGLEHGSSLYLEETHVPLVIWMPGGNRGRRVAEQVGLIDVPVTLLAAAGLPALQNASGRSLLPALTGRTIDQAPAFSELDTLRGPLGPDQHLVALTAGRYRLIVQNPASEGYHLMIAQDQTSSRPATRVELYDLSKDPAEQNNLADVDPDVAAAMLGEIRQFLAAQTALHLKVARQPFKVKLNKTELDQLRAVGYLGQ